MFSDCRRFNETESTNITFESRGLGDLFFCVQGFHVVELRIINLFDESLLRTPDLQYAVLKALPLGELFKGLLGNHSEHSVLVHTLNLLKYGFILLRGSEYLIEVHLQELCFIYSLFG